MLGARHPHCSTIRLILQSSLQLDTGIVSSQSPYGSARLVTYHKKNEFCTLVSRLKIENQANRHIHKHTEVAILALMPTLCSHIFSIFFIIGTLRC